MIDIIDTLNDSALPENFVLVNFDVLTMFPSIDNESGKSSRPDVFCETLLKKSLWHRCFPVNFAKFLRTPFFTKHLWWLLLVRYKSY